VSYSGDAVSMYTHTGTHIDTLNHFGYNGKIFNNFSVDQHLGSRAWDVCGAEKHPPIIARGVLLDVAALHGVAVLPDSHGIGPDDLKGCLLRQGTALRPGDVVMVRTGQMTKWPDPARFMPNPPGLNRAGAQFLCEAGAIMVGVDTASFEQMPSHEDGNWMPVHCYMLAEAGVAIMEMPHLEELAAERLYEYAFFGACIRLRGATGSPMRPVAMPLRA
jgi:kynurenine formamidase